MTIWSQGRTQLGAVLVAVTLAAGLTACGGDAVAPAGAPVLAKGSGSTGTTTELRQAYDTTMTVFDVDPAVTTSQIIAGVHKIVFPAGSICDPSTSSYGPSHWDRPCTPTRRTIRITAVAWTDSAGHPMIDFQPALRFVPAKVVTLFMKDKSALDLATGNVIVFCSRPTRCVNEAESDLSLVTLQDPTNGFYFRRIKHFSGYSVAAGYSRYGSEY